MHNETFLCISPYELQQQRYILPLSLAYLYIFLHIIQSFLPTTCELLQVSVWR